MELLSPATLAASSSAGRISAYLESSRSRHLRELTSFASFASISSLDEHREELLACAAWLEEHMVSIGLSNVRQMETGGNPIVYGESLGGGADAPTLLIYGHYDVQPAEPIAAWTSPPFEPTIRDDTMFARGISDNKGPLFAALKALQAALEVDGALACNVKVVVDGEEELRADRLDAFVDRHRDLLSADLLVNSDGAFLAPGVPSVPIGLRGMVALELTVSTATGDLHSGLFGGVAPNALQVMADLISSLRSTDGRVLVDGFYDDVAKVSAQELAAWDELPIDAEIVREQAGTSGLIGDPEKSVLERQWALPTLDLNGMWGGFEGQGIKTVIPAKAHAKLSCRLVCDQRTDLVLAQVIDHLARHLPSHATMAIDSTLEGAPAMVMPADHPAVRVAQRALTAGFGRPALLTRLGASVPINEIVQRRLGMPAIMVNCSSPTDAFHAPDEHFALGSLDAAVRTMINFINLLPAAWTG